MSTGYIGEIRLFGGNFAPVGWATCDGQLMAISQNDALFNLIGTTYGGDGQETFALPNLQGRVPLHQGSGYVLGQNGGSETVTLVQNQIPSHTHSAVANSATGTQTGLAGNVLAGGDGVSRFASGTPNVLLYLGTVGASGNSQPHQNLQPYQCLLFIICLEGVYPTPN